MSLLNSTHPVWTTTKARTSPSASATPYLVSQATGNNEQNNFLPQVSPQLDSFGNMMTNGLNNNNTSTRSRTNSNRSSVYSIIPVDDHGTTATSGNESDAGRKILEIPVQACTSDSEVSPFSSPTKDNNMRMKVIDSSLNLTPSLRPNKRYSSSETEYHKTVTTESSTIERSPTATLQSRSTSTLERKKSGGPGTVEIPVQACTSQSEFSPFSSPTKLTDNNTRMKVIDSSLSLTPSLSPSRKYSSSETEHHETVTTESSTIERSPTATLQSKSKSTLERKTSSGPATVIPEPSTISRSPTATLQSRSSSTLERKTSGGRGTVEIPVQACTSDSEVSPFSSPTKLKDNNMRMKVIDSSLSLTPSLSPNKRYSSSETEYHKTVTTESSTIERSPTGTLQSRSTSTLERKKSGGPGAVEIPVQACTSQSAFSPFPSQTKLKDNNNTRMKVIDSSLSLTPSLSPSRRYSSSETEHHETVTTESSTIERSPTATLQSKSKSTLERKTSGGPATVIPEPSTISGSPSATLKSRTTTTVRKTSGGPVLQTMPVWGMPVITTTEWGTPAITTEPSTILKSPSSTLQSRSTTTIRKTSGGPVQGPMPQLAMPAIPIESSPISKSTSATLKSRSTTTIHKTSSGPVGRPAITISKPRSIQGTTPFDMTACVKNPSGVTELCDVVSLDDNHYSIKFVPQEMGVHTVSVKHKDMHIPGSPFEFTVGPIAGGGSHKVHAAGPGLERGEVNVPSEFNIYTREAGAGGLSIAVEGPSKAEIDFQDKKDGSCNVSYKVTEPGEYYVSVKFNDEHIPDSPFRVNVTPSIGDARKLLIKPQQDKQLMAGKPAAFVVDFNGAKGRLTARVISPSGAEEEALVQEIDDGQYAVRFIPRENGVHLVHVLFDNYHIPDSPFKIVVGKVDADAGKVTAYGDGLKTGKTGECAKFIVNTVNAGSGSLAVTVEGPSKVKLECKEVEEGYEFSYNPTAPGSYMICIRYAGVNVAGSPFKAIIEGQGQPSVQQEHASVVVETVTKTSTTTRFSGIQRFTSDASKVTAEGKGLNKAFRGKTSTFTVDASGAGNNIMYIGMMGPKGPCDELIVKHQGNLKYSVQYMVKESGRYMLIVRWGDQDIPGSPFAVDVQ